MPHNDFLEPYRLAKQQKNHLAKNEKFMKKILIIIILLGFNSCKNIDQHGSEPDLIFTKKNAQIVHEICETLDFKQAKDGVYKSSDGECVVTGDYPVVREGERCQSKMHCEIEELRAARLQSAREWGESIIKTAEIIEKLPRCKGLNGGEKAKIVYKNDQPYCFLPKRRK